MPDSKAIYSRAVNSIKWVGLSIILPRLLTPLVTVILGKMLNPDDFGIVGIALALNTFADIVVGYNWGMAVIRSENNVNEVANLSFVLMTGLSVMLYGAFWILSPSIATGYDNPILITIIRLVSLSLIISALSAVPKALMEREFRYKQLFAVRTGSNIVANVIVLIWVLLAPSIWVIVAQPILIAVIQFITSYRLTKWRPRFYWNISLAKEILTFNSFIVVSSFVSWLLIYGDNLFAGALLGTTQLGVYILGWNLAMVIPSAIASGMAQLAYTTFSRFQNEPQQIGKQLLQLHRLGSIALFPISAGIAVIAQPFSELVYGNKWLELPEVLMLLSILNLFLHLWNINDRAFRAIGKPQVGLIGPITMILYGAPLLLSFGQDSVIQYSFIRVLITLPFPFIVMSVSARYLDTTILAQIKAVAIPGIVTTIMFVVGYALVEQLGPYEVATDWLKVLFIVFLCTLLYFTALFVLQRKLSLQLLAMLSESLNLKPTVTERSLAE
ncbi:MAG: oligosaccharide flippase family protein [Anaerolineaceae bacterium]|nr:oligosaccharide flippase family protein [Anaerolineaceae bacterium]